MGEGIQAFRGKTPPPTSVLSFFQKCRVQPPAWGTEAAQDLGWDAVWGKFQQTES